MIGENMFNWDKIKEILEKIEILEKVLNYGKIFVRIIMTILIIFIALMKNKSFKTFLIKKNMSENSINFISDHSNGLLTIILVILLIILAISIRNIAKKKSKLINFYTILYLSFILILHIN